MIAGHVGILVNALNLLPFARTTDGGRILKACTRGQNFFLEPVVSFLVNSFVLVQGFRVWGTSSYLLLYAILISFVQHETDVPCRNDVDPTGEIRTAFFGLTTLVALVAISPSF